MRIEHFFSHIISCLYKEMLPVDFFAIDVLNFFFVVKFFFHLLPLKFLLEFTMNGYSRWSSSLFVFFPLVFQNTIKHKLGNCCENSKFQKKRNRIINSDGIFWWKYWSYKFMNYWNGVEEFLSSHGSAVYFGSFFFIKEYGILRLFFLKGQWSTFLFRILLFLCFDIYSPAEIYAKRSLLNLLKK